MNRKAVLGIMRILLFIGMLTSVFNLALASVQTKEDFATLQGANTNDWPMFRHDNMRTGFTEGPAPNTNTVLWKHKTEGGVHSSPAVINGKILVGSSDTNVYALNEDTGALIWNFKTNETIVCSPAVANSKVFIGSNDGILYALDELNGNRLWSYKTPKHPHTPYGSLITSPAVNEGKVFIGSDDGYVYALDENTGVSVWKSKPGYGDAVSSPAVTDEKVFVISKIMEEVTPHTYYSIAYLFALDKDTGELLWKYRLGEGLIQVGPYFGRSSPTVSSNKVFVGGEAYGYIRCLNASSGELIWEFKSGAGSTSSPAVANGKIFFAQDDGYVYALNETSGEEMWHYKTGASVMSSPAIADGRVFIGSGDGYVYAFGTKAKILLGIGRGWMKIGGKESVYGRAELYKIGDEQIEIVITYEGEEYSRRWNIISHREYKHGEAYLCHSQEWRFLIVRLHKDRWHAVGKGVKAFGL